MFHRLLRDPRVVPVVLLLLGSGLSCREQLASRDKALQTSPTRGRDGAPVLSAGSVETRPLAPGAVEPFAILLTAGDYLEVSAEQQGMDLALVLYGPADGRLLRIDSPIGKTGVEALIFWAKDDGRYRLDVESLEKASSGAYRLEVISLRPATEADRLRARAASTFAEAEELRRHRSRESRRQAVTAYESAAALWQQAGDREAEATCYERIAWTLTLLDKKREAVTARLRALEILEQLGDSAHLARSLTEMGRNFQQLGELDRAEGYYRRALPLWRQVCDLSGEAEVLNNLANLSSLRGALGEAQAWYEEALTRWQQLDDGRNQAITLTNLAGLYAVAGEAERSLDLCVRALASLPAHARARDRAFVLEQTAGAYRRLGRDAEAADAYAQALVERRKAEDHRGQAYALDGLALLRYQAQDYGSALALYEQSLELFRAVSDRLGEATALQNLGWVHYKQGEYAASLDLYHLSLPLARDTGNRRSEGATLLGIARVERDRGNLEEARAWAEEALAVVENLRAGTDRLDLRTTLFAEKQDYFDVAIDILMQLHAGDRSVGYEARAFHLSERSRARLLLDALPADWAPGSPLDREQKRRRRELQDRVNAAQERQAALAAAGAAATVLEATARDLREALDQLRRFEARRAAAQEQGRADLPAVLSLAEVQRHLLDERTLLLEYELGVERSYLWAVSKTSVDAFRLPPAEILEAAALETHHLLANSNRRATSTRTQHASRSLSQLLLGPVADLLVDQRLIIVPEGVLHYLPFGALQRPTASADEGEPLLARHEIVYVPSASVAIWMRQHREGRTPALRTLAVLADPVFSTDDRRLRGTRELVSAPVAPIPSDVERVIEDLSAEHPLARLPHSGKEAKAILALVPRTERLGALGLAATKEFVAGGAVAEYRIVHFATHGILNAEHPELSGLILSLVDEAGRPRDGFLRAHEIYDLDLAADLVVLSACQTALGRRIRGEGLVGLSHGFFRAGAAKVLVSLWQVNDEAAADLMTRLYHGLLQDGLSPEAALRQAQLSLAREPQWRRPYFWAGFVLQGDG